VDIEPRIGATIDVKCGAANPGLAADAVAKRNTPRRGRSRKRRTTRSTALPAPDETPQPGKDAVAAQPRRQASPAGGRAARARTRGGAARGSGAFKDPQSVGERPPAPWHPLPLSELLILVGAIGAAVGYARRPSHLSPTLLAGIAAVVIGTVEVTLREHRSGYRSHTVMLALLPTIVFHSVVALTVAAFTQVPRLLNVGLLVLDGALFAFLYKLLRARFLDARRERTFAGRR
jgi:hypothetical protein